MLPTKERIVIVAMDESECSRNAFEWYWSNVHAENDRIIILHVPEYEDLAQSPLEVGMEDDSNEAFKDAEKMRNDFLGKLEDLLQERQLKGEVRSENGEPGETIVSVAKKEDADLIVVGNLGMGEVQHAELGTVCDYVINHAPSPVTLYKG